MHQKDTWYPCPCRCSETRAAETEAASREYYECGEREAENASCRGANPPCTTTRCVGTADDFGPNPYVVDIEAATLANPFYRRALWTGTHLQLTLMCIPPCGEIGLEMHADLDQFLRLEQGRGRVVMGPSENSLNFTQNVSDGSAIFIPAGTWHNLRNTGNEPIKLYSIYSPVQHPAGILQCTKADAAD